MGGYASDTSGMGDFHGSEFSVCSLVFPTDLHKSRAGGWNTTQCANIATLYAMSVMALLIRSVADASGTNKLVRIWSLKVSHSLPNPACSDTDAMVVDYVSAARPRVQMIMATPVPAIPLTKKVTAKGKPVPHRTTRPWAHKFMQVTSPSLAVAGVPSPNPLISDPSMETWPSLFKEAVQLGGKEIGLGAQVSSGEWHRACACWYSLDLVFQFSGP